MCACVCLMVVPCSLGLTGNAFTTLFSPSQYDVNSDGVLEFLLATIEAELVFVSTGGSLLHGETIKASPGETTKTSW